MERRDKAATIAIASALVIVAAAILSEGVKWRLVLGLVIAVPSLVMATYYVVDREAYDRPYSVSLFILIALAGAYIAGAGLRLVAAAAVLVVAAALVVTVLSGRGRKSESRGRG